MFFYGIWSKQADVMPNGKRLGTPETSHVRYRLFKGWEVDSVKLWYHSG